MATSNGATLEQATTYAGAEDLPLVRREAVLRDAERLVRDIAPPPDPAPVEYRVDALDAELRTFSWLCSHGDGNVKSESVDGVSLSYTDKPEPVYDLVARLMNRWIKGTPPRPTVSKNAFSNVLGKSDLW